MPTDIEKLVVQLSADFRKMESSLNRSRSIADKQFKAIESRAVQLDKRLSGIGANAFKGLMAPIAGISAALSTAEVIKYADAWTGAKNSLAVAGVVGEKQADVLDRLFKSAQANATPITALSDLYGKAAQASDNLGASQEDLLKFSDGVAVALNVSGSSAEQASGALQQLSQLLGSATVQAEEFNSVNDGARPILIAVANGLDDAGGSVSKLKAIVNEGALSSKEFFNAFLRGLPTIQSMAANSTQTISQGITKVNNAMTKFVGETDSSLGASQRLVQGLNALADNFDATADMVLKLAAVIAGALVGRSIAGMIAKLGMGVVALYNFTKALRTAQTGLAFAGLTTSLGPIGAVIGVAATAAALFATSSTDASEASDGWAEALDKVRDSAKGATSAVKELNAEQAKEQSVKIEAKMDVGKEEIDTVRLALDELFARIASAPTRFISGDLKKQLKALDDGLKDGSVSAEEVKQKLTDLGETNSIIKDMTAEFGEYLDILGLSVKAMKELNAERTKLAGIADAPSASPGSAGQLYLERQKKTDFLNQRNADSMKTDLEKNVETRAKAITDAAAKIGVVMTEAAAKIQARTEIANENLVQASTASANSAAEMLKKYESFRSTPYFDVNHQRVGYGSDTVTLSDGSVREVTAGISVSVEDANRDLVRRIGETQSGIRDKVGAGTFNSLNEQQQAVLTSIAYNYGTLPDRIVKALQTGDAGNVYQAIKGLGADNGGINEGRRNDEAATYLNGAPSSITSRVQSTEDFAQQMKEQQQMLVALKAETGIRASLNPLIADYGKKMSEVEKAQELLKMAQQEGTAAGRELVSVQQLLNGDLTKMSPAAREQALAMRALAVEYGTATAASNQLKESQDKLATSTASSVQLQKDVISGALTDIRSALEDGKITAKEWGNIVVNMLSKVADKAQELLIDQLFSGGGGLLGLFGGGAAAGGAVASGSAGAGGVSSGGMATALKAPKMAKLPAGGGASGAPSHVVVSVDDDGKIAAYVAKQGEKTKLEVRAESHATVNGYRNGKFHDDVEAHLTRRRVKGRTG